MFRHALLALLLVPTVALTAPVPKEVPVKGPTILVWNDGKPLLLDTGGKVVKELPETGKGEYTAAAPRSPDGRRVALLRGADPVRLANGRHLPDHRLAIGDPADAKAAKAVAPPDGEHFVGAAVWGRDGTRLYAACVSLADANARARAGNRRPVAPNKYAVIDPATGKTERIELPDDHHLVGEAADDRLVIADREGHITLASADGKKVEAVKVEYPPRCADAAVSADGKRVLMLVSEGRYPDRLAALDLGTGKVTLLDRGGLPEGIRIARATWSPDGGQVLFLYQQLESDPPPRPGLPQGVRVAPKGHLCVADADGSNPQTIREHDDANALYHFDWR